MLASPGYKPGTVSAVPFILRLELLERLFIHSMCPEPQRWSCTICIMQDTAHPVMCVVLMPLGARYIRVHVISMHDSNSKSARNLFNFSMPRFRVRILNLDQFYL